MCLTIFGILLTTNGRLLSQILDPNYKFQSAFSNYKSDSNKTVLICSFLLISFMFFMAYAIYITNKIKATSYQVNFVFGLKLYLISSLIYSYSLPQSGSIDKSIFYWSFLYSGLSFAIAEICFVSAIILTENIGMTIMLGAITIVVSYFFSIIRYS